MAEKLSIMAILEIKTIRIKIIIIMIIKTKKNNNENTWKYARIQRNIKWNEQMFQVKVVVA